MSLVSEVLYATSSCKTITIPIIASKTTKNNKAPEHLCSNRLDEYLLQYINKRKVTNKRRPLNTLWVYSIIADESKELGTILPLQVGQDAPHPSPEPVPLTTAPARIDMTQSTRPVKAKLFSLVGII